MELRFGSALTLKDGAQVGAIQRVVLEPETQRLRALTLRTGHVFARERVIGASRLGLSSDERRVVADLDASDIDHLPTISDVDLTDTFGSRNMVQPFTTWTGGEMPVATFVAGGASPSSSSQPSFDLPAADRDVTLVSSRTIVHGSGGEKIGSVCGVVCDNSGTAIGLLIKRSQLFRSREIFVPTDLATYSGTASVLLGLEWKE